MLSRGGQAASHTWLAFRALRHHERWGVLVDAWKATHTMAGASHDQHPSLQCGRIM